MNAIENRQSAERIPLLDREEILRRDSHYWMIRRVQEVCIKQAGRQACPEFSGSTDANIPMSLDIPALCAGLLSGGGAHTVGEWVYKHSLPIGMRIGAEIILDYFEI